MPSKTQHQPKANDPEELAKHINGVRERLSKEFQPRVAPEIVSREVDEVARSFDGARITTYVPVLVNRQVRMRLRELASHVSSHVA